MRSQLWLLAVAASGRLATAHWALGEELDGRGGGLARHVPRQTQASGHDDTGFTPKPTDGPSLELARRRQDWALMRRQTTANTWVDDTTCGWRADSASFPFTCPRSYACATNTDQVVGCSSAGGENPFFTVCMDYQAVLGGKCDTIGAKTGCCMTASLGECITYIWPGTPLKSMYRCWTERVIITMLATPAGLTTSSSTSSTRPPSSSTTSTSTTSETSSSTSATASQTTTAPPASGGGSNTGAIVGGVVGGVGGVALIAGAIAMFIIRSRRKDTQPGAGTTYSAVAPAEPTAYNGAAGAPPSAYPPSSSVSPQMSQAGYFAPGSVGTTLQPGTPYLSTPSPPAGGGVIYDPRTSSYYDPAKLSEQQQMQMQQQQQQYPAGGYVPYPGPQQQQQGMYPPPPGAYPAHQAIELDNTTVPAGQQGNPVEMAASPASPHTGAAPPR